MNSLAGSIPARSHTHPTLVFSTSLFFIAHKTPFTVIKSEYKQLLQNPYLNTLPPVYLFHALPLTALLLPTVVVITWSGECAFFSTASFTWEAFGDLALPLGASICAAAVFLFRNPMHALLALLGVFFLTVLLYLIAGIAFVGLVFLIVYVGAVAVLFLFVIMLLNVKSLTSKDLLIQYISQLVAITGTTALLVQLHVQLIGALNRALANGFLRDAIIEPTTGEAILYYIRYQAMDINALTGLYTLHAILLMLITSILLAALLGAIILATVTTERATALSDIRKYSTVALSFSFLFFIIPVSSGELLDLLADFDFDYTPFSFYYFKARRDQEIRNIRTRGQDTYVTQHSMFDTRRYPGRLRPLMRAAARMRWRTLRRFRSSPAAYAAKWRQLYRGEVSSKTVLRACRRPRVFRIYAAAAALAPILARRYRNMSAVRIMRRRWVWRWRRNRAAWLWRSELAHTELTKRVSNKERRKNYPKITKRQTKKKMRVWNTRFYGMQRFSIKLNSVLRLFGKRRLPLFQYLRLIMITRVYPCILYWAWRVRAFCVFFICFMFLVPFVATTLWLFLEEQLVVWERLCDVHKAAVYYFNNWTDLQYADPSVARIGVAVFIFPITVYCSALAHPEYLVIISLLLAYNAVLAQGGELSDAEFQESRCNYWHKLGNDYNDYRLALIAAEALARSKRHPDKGRTDLPWFIAQYLPAWLTKVIDWIIDLHVSAFWLLVRISDFLQLPQVYRCLRGVFREISRAIKSVLPQESIFEKYPVLLDMYNALAQPCSDAASWLTAVLHAIWIYICSNFYKIGYRLDFLDALDRMLFYIMTKLSLTLFALVLCTAIVLYCFASLLLFIPWRRTYGRLVRRPSFLIYVALLLVTLYIFGNLAPYMAAWSEFAREPRFFSSLHQLIFSQRRTFYGYVYHLLRLEWVGALLFIAPVAYVYYFFYGWWRTRQLHRGRALVFRNYVNAYLHLRETYIPDFKYPLDDALAALPADAAAAFKAACADAKAARDLVLAKRTKRLRRMIWRRLTYIPKYYDPHPDVEYRKHYWAPAYHTHKHTENPHHSKYSFFNNHRRGNIK